MAMNCDEIFSQIQERQLKAAQINRSIGELDSMADDLSPKQEDDLFRRAAGLGPADKAAEDVAKGRKSNRQKDRFNNAKALTDRVGEEQATSLLTLLRGLDETWQAMDPEDYAKQVAAYSRAELTEAVGDAAQAAGLDLSDSMVNGVQANLAPFLPILRNQATLKAYAEIGRAGYMTRLDELTALLDGGNYTPDELVKAKKAVVDGYLKAVTAQRARNIARTRSGQLLRNERDLMGNTLDMNAVPAVGRSAEVAVDGKTGKVAVDPRTAEKIKQVQDDIEAMIGEKVGATVQELSDPGSSLNRVINAANEGKKGVPELKRVAEEVKAASDLVDDDLDTGFEFGYEKYARAGYKDSILGGLKSIIQNNYLSQKLVFAAEGYMAMPRNAVTIYANNVRNPVGTANWRNPKLALTQGSAAAVRANFVAESVIKQSWKETFSKDMFQSDLPFAGNVDRVNSRTGQLSIADQYNVGRKVMEEKLSPNPMRMAMQLRNKLAWGSKMFANAHIERMTGKKLPVLSVLQGNTVIDNRAGLRTFMTVRANQLQMDYYRLNPEANPKQAVEYANSKIAEELYNARPSDAQVNAYREQFNIGQDVSNDQIKETIVMSKVGEPLLDTPDRQEAFQLSRDFRMQGNNADAVPGLNELNKGLQQLRQSEWGDYMVPFLKSWAEQTAWDLGTGGLSAAKNVWEIAGTIKRGDVVTPEMYGQAAGSLTMTATLLTVFAGMEAMGDDAPVQLIGTARDDQEEMALRNAGKMPNTLHIKGAPQLFRNLPIGNMPLVKTLLLYKDLSNLRERGLVSDADFLTQMGGITTVFAGLLLRAPGMYQLQWLMRALGNIGEEGSLQQNISEFGARFVASSLPTSGFSRTVGQVDSGVNGTDYNSLIDSRRVMEQEADVIEKLPPDHPLKSIWTKVQNFLAAGGTPELVRLMGGRDRKFTYLGRKWNGLPYLPAGSRTDWPDGVPALQLDGDYAVESELDRLNQYNEPEVFQSHMLDGVPVTPMGINDLEEISGSMVSGGYNSEFRLGNTEYLRNGRVMTRKGPNVGPLLRRLTKGKTWREALNALFTSDEYAKWNANPATTNNGSMTDEERNARPGTQMVIAINRHYTDLLGDRFVEAGANTPDRYPGAAQFILDRNVVLPTREEATDATRLLRDVTRTRETAQ